MNWFIRRNEVQKNQNKHRIPGFLLGLFSFGLLGLGLLLLAFFLAAEMKAPRQYNGGEKAAGRGSVAGLSGLLRGRPMASSRASAAADHNNSADRSPPSAPPPLHKPGSPAPRSAAVDHHRGLTPVDGAISAPMVACCPNASHSGLRGAYAQFYPPASAARRR